MSNQAHYYAPMSAADCDPAVKGGGPHEYAGGADGQTVSSVAQMEVTATATVRPPFVRAPLSLSEALRAMHHPSAVVNVNSRAFRVFNGLSASLVLVALFFCIGVIAGPLTALSSERDSRGYTTIVELSYWCYRVAVEYKPYESSTSITTESYSKCMSERPYRCDKEKTILFASAGVAIAAVPPILFAAVTTMSAAFVKTNSLGRQFEFLSKGLVPAQLIAMPLLIVPFAIGHAYWTTTTEWCPKNPNASFKANGYGIGASPVLAMIALIFIVLAEVSRLIFLLVGLSPRAGQPCPWYDSTVVAVTAEVTAVEGVDGTALLSTTVNGTVVDVHNPK